MCIFLCVGGSVYVCKGSSGSNGNNSLTSSKYIERVYENRPEWVPILFDYTMTVLGVTHGSIPVGPPLVVSRGTPFPQVISSLRWTGKWEEVFLYGITESFLPLVFLGLHCPRPRWRKWWKRTLKHVQWKEEPCNQRPPLKVKVGSTSSECYRTERMTDIDFGYLSYVFRLWMLETLPMSN